MDQTVTRLLDWASKNGIQLHPSLRVQSLPDDSGRTSTSVFSHQAIEKNEIVVSIPKAAILSVKSCTLARVIPPAPYGLGAQLALSLALCHELAQGAESRWYGYLQSLPSETVPIALLWGDDDAFGSDPDGEAAREWISGTEVERTLRGEEGVKPMDEIREYYRTVAAPLLPASCTLSHFLRAYSLVSSRAFMVDAYHGLSMVPIADAFNHTTENHVHLECDFDVCPLCGSFAECPHDRDDALPSSSEPMDWQAPSVPSVPDTCDMVVNRRVPAGSEVFNTYGARKTNASLLAWYGFALDSNENDVVGWDLSDIAQELDGRLGLEPSALPSEESYTAVLQAWLSSLGSMVADESMLVYRPTLEDGEERSFVGPSTVLCVNSDAQLSVYLWVYLAICAAAAESYPMQEPLTPHGIERLVAFLGATLAEQVSIEKALGIGEGEHTTGSDDTILPIVSRIAELVDMLCQHWIAKIGKQPSVSTTRLGEMLDEIPETHRKTRLAIEQVLAERSILEGCQAGWRELRDVTLACIERRCRAASCA